MAGSKDDTALVQALSGIGGQVFSSLITYPLDVVKTRVQTSLVAKEQGGVATDDSFSGMLSTILTEGGWRALYHGLDGEITKESFKTFVYFYVYTWAKARLRAKQLPQPPPPPPPTEADNGNPACAPASGRASSSSSVPPLSVGANLCAGAFAAACGQLANTPMNVAHTRMVAGTSTNGFFGTIADIYAEGGIAELYAGILPSLLLTCNPAINYAVFDQTKAAWLAHKMRTARAIAAEAGGEVKASNGSQLAQESAGLELSAVEAFLIGVIAKLTSTVLTYPLIRAKVVVQSGVSKYSSTLLVMLMLMRDEGIFGVYKGLKPQLMRAICGGALLVMGKEKIQQMVRAVVVM